MILLGLISVGILHCLQTQQTLFARFASQSILAPIDEYLISRPPRPSSKNHTYLVDIWPLKNGSDGSTRPPLHIGASRTAEYPSGSSSAEFLIAYTGSSCTLFIVDHRLARWHEEEIRIALLYYRGPQGEVFPFRSSCSCS